MESYRLGLVSVMQHIYLSLYFFRSIFTVRVCSAAREQSANTTPSRAELSSSVTGSVYVCVWLERSSGRQKCHVEKHSAD